MKKSIIEKFLSLSEAQKEAEIAPFTRETVRTRALTPAERKRWNRIRRGLGRPKIGRGSVVMPVSIERGLLEEVNRFAAAHDLKRSQMVAEGLRLLMRRKAG